MHLIMKRSMGPRGGFVESLCSWQDGFGSSIMADSLQNKVFITV
jgi:hypothetical protein